MGDALTNQFSMEDLLNIANGVESFARDWMFSVKESVFNPVNGVLYRKHPTLLGRGKDWVVVRNASTDELIWFEGVRLDKPVTFFFENCVIPAIYIKKMKMPDVNFIFIHSTIEGQFHVAEESELGNIYLLDGSSVDSFSLERSRCENVEVERESAVDYIGIGNYSQLRDLTISMNSTCGSVSIGACCLAKSIAIVQESKSKNIHINGTSFVNGLTINNSSCGNISIFDRSHVDGLYVKGSTTGIINIYDDSHCRHLLIGKRSTIPNIYVTGCDNAMKLDIDNSLAERVELAHILGNIRLANAVCQFMRFTDCQLHQVSLEAGTRGEFYIQNAHINYLALKKTAILKDTVISVVDSSILIIQLQELLVQGLLIFRNCRALPTWIDWQPKFHSMTDADPENYGETPLAGVIGELRSAADSEKSDWERRMKELAPQFRDLPLFRIVDSSLGKTEITGSQLQSFRFEYRDSKLLEVFIAGTQISREKIRIYQRDLAEPLAGADYYRQKVTVYNQLKRIFENQGDVVETTWYHSRAMDNQEKVLRLNYQTTRVWFSEQRFDLLNFQLNKLSNNHGESWRRALLFLVGISFIFYSGYYASIFYNRPFSWAGTGTFIGDYFSYFDITHKSDFLVPHDQLTPLAKILDFFGRIMIGYGIYQFVAAFRRHGRKG